MKRNEIYLANFPFGGSSGMKLRPVLLLTNPVGTIPEVLVAYISSVMPSSVMPSDLILDPAIPEHASTNLKKKSVVRLHKLATLHARSIVRHLGMLSTTTELEVADKLRKLLEIGS